MDRPIRVLHVEDNPEFAELTASFLEREHDQLTVDTATSASEGLDEVTEEVDCIVSDYDMPRTNGLSFLEAVREEYPDLPFILFTGKGSEEIASDAISAGVTDYLQKGGGTDQYTVLANRIENAVDAYRSKHEARERQRRLETLINNLPGIVYQCRNEDGWPMESVAGDCEEITGHLASALEDGEISFGDDLIHPKDREHVWTTVQEHFEEGETYELTYRIVTRDGETKWVWERGQGTDTADDDVERLEGFITDVTDRKQQSRQFEAVFNNTYTYLGLLEPDGTLVEANDTALSFAGLDNDDVAGEPIWESFWFRGIDRTKSAARDAVESARNGEMYRDEIRVEGSNGEAVIDFSIRPITDDQDEVRFLVAEGRDITEQKDRERTLTALHSAAREIGRAKDRETVYETLIETAEQILDFDLVAVDVERDGYLIQEAWTLEIDSDGYYERTSLEDDTFATRSYNRQETIIVDDLRESEITPADPEYRSALTVPIGEFGTFQAVFSEVDAFDDRDREFAELLVDHARVKLTQLQGEQALRERTAELEHKNERLDQFASVVSHDLRNPLNTLELSLDMAERTAETEHFERCQRSVTRMNTLIENLLTLAREGEDIDEREPVELDATVEEAWETVNADAAELTVETTRTLDADRTRLKQLLENLLHNAVEHGADSGQQDDGEAGVHVTVGDLDDGFYVADDGPGIQKAERERMFEAGYSTAENGIGFGLAIVQEIVEAHGWDIAVTDSADGGARFEISDV